MDNSSRVIEDRDGLPGNEIWLYMRRLSDGKLKYSISNAPVDMPKSILDAQTLKRWPITASIFSVIEVGQRPLGPVTIGE